MYLYYMADTTVRTFEYGKRYKFPQLSAPDMEVLETIENWVEFYQEEFVWCSHYRGMCKDDEDPQTKVVEDREKEFYWRYTFSRSIIVAAEVSYDHGLMLWLTNIYMASSDKVIRLAFNTKDKAERMYTYFCQYKGFTHY